jgi:hypothetical protein
LSLTITPNVAQEKVTEGNPSDARCHRTLADLAHSCFVDFIGTRPWQGHDPEWQPRSFRLCFKYRTPRTVHSNSVELAVHRREQPDDFAISTLTEQM